MQTEPASQPATQAPAGTGHNDRTTPATQQPRCPHQPKQLRTAVAPQGGRASFAAVAAAGAAAGAAAAVAAAGAHAPKQPPIKSIPSATGGRQKQAAAPPSSFAATYHVRRNFIFKAPLGTLPDTAASLKDRVTTLLQARLPGTPLPIADAVHFGSQAASTRVFFTLGSLEAADELVGRRSALKGSGISLQDFLTPEEQKIKRALWPRFMEAKASGQRAQFQRARLVVS